MKYYYTIALVFLTLASASCQEVQKEKFKIEVHVSDIDKLPVKDAVVTGGSEKILKNTSIPQANYENVVAKTDINGRAILDLTRYSGSPSAVLINKEGYYKTKQAIKWTKNADGISNNDAKFNATLKPVKNPVKMIYHRACGTPIHELNKNYGVDLEIGDAVAPLGKGKTADIFVSITEVSREENMPNAYVATIVFANPLDGFTEFIVDNKANNEGSVLWSDYKAPLSNYKNNLTRETTNLRDSKFFENLENEKTKCYYFRARSVRNSDGAFIESNYGKIYGAIKISMPSKFSNNNNSPFVYFIIEDVYFNSNNNDINVECDTTLNLSPKLDEYGKPIKITRP